VKKKVDVKDLQIGMYVCEVDRPWLETPFLFQGFPVNSRADIKMIQQICKYVYIDIEKGLDAQTSVPAAVAHKRVVEEMTRTIKHPAPPKDHYPIRVPLKRETPVARKIHKKTRRLIDRFLEDVRLGRSIDSASAKVVVTEMAESIMRNPNALTWFTLLKKKDEYTSIHSMNVCILALAFGRHLGLSKDKLTELGVGALLHDIGKLKIPEQLLRKTEKLSKAEFELMRSHTTRGKEILEQTPGLPTSAADIAYSHHERNDGHGYPLGRNAEALSLFSKMVAIVDVYDAITSDRAYHDAISPHSALRDMYEWRESDFDGALVENFIQCLGIYPAGTLVELSSGDLGIVVEVNPLWHLRPKVLLILDPDRKRRAAPALVDLASLAADDSGRPLEIRNVLEPGSYGVDLWEYVNKGSPPNTNVATGAAPAN